MAGSRSLSFTVLQLLALESIYGDNVIILGNQSGMKRFQVGKQLRIVAFSRHQFNID